MHDKKRREEKPNSPSGPLLLPEDYDEAMSEEKRNAHRGVIQQLNRSAPKSAIPQVVEKFGVPDGI